MKVFYNIDIGKAKLIPNIDRIHSDEQFRLKRE